MTAVLAVVVAAVVAFLLSGAWYAALGSRLAAVSPAYAQRPAAATAGVELARNAVVAVVAAVVTGLVAALALDGVGRGLLLALALWIGFPVVLLAGSVFHERVPPLLAAIHTGDWLLKLVAITVVTVLWP